MRALSVLYGGQLSPEAFEDILPGTAFSRALAAAGKFPGVEKTVLLGAEGKSYGEVPGEVEITRRPSWTAKSLLEELSVFPPALT